MPRALFEKTGSAIYISHLDLMRLFQRAFKRAGLPLTHTKGYNPRPSVSIALPLSLGVESLCELLDFELEGEGYDNDDIMARLNANLTDGVKVRQIYDDMPKIKNIALLECELILEYDAGVPEHAREQIETLFASLEVIVEKKGKNGVTEQNIIPLIRRLDVEQEEGQIRLNALVCCQNPALNPMQLTAAISKYLPELTPGFVRCCRVEIFDMNETVFR